MGKAPTSKNLQNTDQKPRHSLFKIDAVTMTAICAICGKTDIRSRTVYRKYTVYVCATKKQQYTLEYRHSHNPPTPPNPSAHRLSVVDYETKTAVCSQCGPVKIYVSRRKNTIGRRCSKANSQDSARAYLKRQKANRIFIDTYKVQQGCHICGRRTRSDRLDLHRHDANGKEEQFSRLLALGHERLLLELKKWQVLCWNCHDLTHTKLGLKVRPDHLRYRINKS